MLGQISAGSDGIRIVARDDPEDVLPAQLGQERVDGGRGDEQDPCGLVDLRGRDCGVGAVVPGDEGHAVAHHLAGGSDRLLGVAEVVGAHHPHRLAEHATGGVEVGHGEVGRPLQLLTEPGILAGQRAEHADQDLGSGGRAAEHRHNHGDREQSTADHGGPP
jgi:hypothetical protein